MTNQKIVFIGPCGSGKSTLASKLYAAFKEQKINAEFIPELVRYEIHRNGPMRSIWEQYRTRQAQKDIEDLVPDKVNYTIIDSGTLTPYFYATLYANQTDPRERLVMQDMYKYLLDDIYLQRYQHVFYLPPIQDVDINDGTRYQTNEEVDTLSHHMDLVFNRIHKTPNIYYIDGPAEERFGKIEAIFVKNGLLAKKSVSSLVIPQIYQQTAPIDTDTVDHNVINIIKTFGRGGITTTRATAYDSRPSSEEHSDDVVDYENFSDHHYD